MTLSPKRIRNAFAKKLAYIRGKRGLRMRDTAAQLGLSTSRYVAFEKGLDLPRPHEMERINAWAWEGKTFTKEAKRYDKYRKGKWRYYRVGVPSRDVGALRDAAEALGLTIDDFFTFVARRYLDNEPVVTHHKQAAEAYAEQRALELINDGTSLTRFLEGDTTKLVKESKAPTGDTNDTTPSSHAQFVEKPYDDEDAERLTVEDIEADMWIEEDFYG
jgi:transcriptional regulator with XRE-family HTH domain